VGDALGAAVEFMDMDEILRAFGPEGIRDPAPAHGRARGAITDDTQMLLFTAEGLIRARHERVAGGAATPAVAVHAAYSRWLRT
jgi:ADP-ribosylglycohydrolase